MIEKTFRRKIDENSKELVDIEVDFFIKTYIKKQPLGGYLTKRNFFNNINKKDDE